MRKYLLMGMAVLTMMLTACHKDDTLECTQWQGTAVNSYTLPGYGKVDYDIDMLLEFKSESAGTLHAVYDITMTLESDSVSHMLDTVDALFTYYYEDKAGKLSATVPSDALPVPGGTQTLEFSFTVDGNTMTMAQDDMSFTLTKVK